MTFTLYNVKINKKIYKIFNGVVFLSGVKIVHIADAHLGSAFSGLPYEKSELRRKEALHTCIKSIEAASDADVLLLSGDIFDSDDIPTSYADSFLSAIDALGSVPVFYSCGNHDSYFSDIVKYCLKNLPANMHIFEPDKISCVLVDNKKIRVYGASFSGSHCNTSIFDTMPSCDDAYINILCMHADTASDVYNYLDVSKLAQTGLDYAALGHIHFFDGFKKSGSCLYAYPGIPEGRGFDECGEKGYIKGKISKHSANLKFYPVSKRMYIDEKIDISDFKTEYELIDVLNSLCGDDGNICRFTFIGENNLKMPVNTKFISSQCNACEITCIDSSVMSISPEEYVSQSGLRGLCAIEAQKFIAKAQSDEEVEKCKKAFSLIVDLFENR